MTKTSIKSKHSKKGVALIFFTLIFAVFLGFTMVVMNTGLLIFQKMRLQSAVDLASYAGASVQASYLGNQSSGPHSLKAINAEIKNEYFDLLDRLQQASIAPWPQGFPDPGTCAAACVGANLVNGQNVVRQYQRASNNIQDRHDQIRHILASMPEAVQAAIEETLALNIPELKIEGGGLGGAFGQTTNRVDEILSGRDRDLFNQRKNAVLSFSSSQGMYLATAVAPVPHSFTYYGPACFNMFPDTTFGRYYYCTVNGQGVGGGYQAFAMANIAYARGLAGGPYSGNIGRVQAIAEQGSNAIRLNLVEDVFKPQPYVVAAAEWHPQIGNRMNFENSFGAQGSLFPQRTRLAAVSAAEPFGGSLVSNFNTPFGTRLQGIRKLLLDPRMDPVRGDFPGLYDYMQSFGPVDGQGQSRETAEEVIKRFLH